MRAQEVFRNENQMTWYSRDANGCFVFKQNLEDMCQAVADYCISTGKSVDDIKARHFREEIDISLLPMLLKRCRNKGERKKLFDKVASGNIHGQFRWMQTNQKELKPENKNNYAVGQITRIRVYEIIKNKGQK